MADKYDNNKYNSSDFKRNSNQDMKQDLDHEQDGEEGANLNEKAGEYMRELLSEKVKLNNTKFPISIRLIDQEVTHVQANGRVPAKDFKYVDVFRDKPTKVTVKVLVPVKDHPKFNFVGKLLGPKGNTLKQLQDETMCKMAVLGRGSMRDRKKEEEFRNSLDPKYSHLSDELHVEISTFAPPAEAHARIAYALAEVKKYLIPDSNDGIWHSQMRNIDQDVTGSMRPLLVDPPSKSVLYSACTVTKRSFSYQDPVVSNVHEGSYVPSGARAGPPPRPPPRVPPPPPHGGHHPPPHAPPHHRSMQSKTKVISILDRVRTAIESPYSYDDPYGAAPEPPYDNQQIRGPRGAAPDQDMYYERSHERYYEEDPYYKDEGPRECKTTSREVGTRRPAPRHYARAAPYARPKTAGKKRSQ